MMRKLNLILRFLGLGQFHVIRITLIGHPREGGYTYLTSPELPGFTFMLEPGEETDLRRMINALYEPLTFYLDAHIKGQARADSIRLTGLRQTKSMNYIAEACPV